MANIRYDLEERLVEFAVSVCELAVAVRANPVGCHVRGQLTRSATAVAANYGEARAAESRKDFVRKLRRGLKELRETMIWLKMLDRLDFVRDGGLPQVIEEANELTAIFVASISTALENSRKPDPRDDR